jgi:hypothetical protein
VKALAAEERKKLMDGFVDDFVLNVDLYATPYCGYWLRGMGMIDDKRWLAVDMIGACQDPNGKSMVVDLSVLDEQEEEIAILALKGEPLPKSWFVIDRTVGEKAYAIGERRWGERWLAEKGDGTTYDLVVQEALLGETFYG